MGESSVAASRGALRTRSIVDHVYTALRERILAGELKPGARLRQEGLALSLGVSRTPLREALRRLASEGLVELETNRGASVARLGFEDMQQAWIARLVMEPGAARLAAEGAPASAVTRMRSSIAAQRRSHADLVTSFEANREFHLALVAASGNPHLIHFSEMLWVVRIGMRIFERQATDSAEVLAWADEHERITDAVEGGQGDLAERSTRAHIARYPPRPAP